MMRLVILLFGFASGLGQIGAAQDRTLLAEGDYVAQNENGSKPVAHWKLSQLSGGEFEVTESFVNNPYLTAIFRFDVHFLPIGYSIAINPIPSGAPPRAGLHSTNLSCVYKASELACDGEYEGGKSERTSISVREPYMVFLDEGWFADVTWALTGVVRLMQHGGTKETLVNTYVIKDNETGTMILKPEPPTKLVLVGEEKANVLGKMQTVRRYEERDSTDPWVLLVTMDGLVANASLEGKRTSTKLAMSNYQQYKPLEFNGR
jgi:hypothetical protein